MPHLLLRYSLNGRIASEKISGIYCRVDLYRLLLRILNLLLRVVADVNIKCHGGSLITQIDRVVVDKNILGRNGQNGQGEENNEELFHAMCQILYG